MEKLVYERLQARLREQLHRNPFLGNRREGYQTGVRCAMSKLHSVYHGQENLSVKEMLEALQRKLKRTPRKPMEQGFNIGLTAAMEEIKKEFGK